MDLGRGAETVVRQCLDVQEGEETVVLNDGNDQKLIEALLDVLENVSARYELIEYEEPDNHGAEPPRMAAQAMKEADVFIAPTKKSISHTRARVKANEAGSRGATMPGIDREVWNTSLQADYNEVERISRIVYGALEDTEKVHITTPSGTNLEIAVDIEFYEMDTGIIHNPGEFGNLPAGEADGGALDAEGVLVVDHIPFVEGGDGVKLRVTDNRVVEVEGPEGNPLQEKFESVSGSRDVAEFGFGTNPEATLIGNILQDEKVLGTVHVAVGDNSSYIPEGDPRRVECPLHWDMVCREPTVKFDDKVMLEEGEPVFLN